MRKNVKKRRKKDYKKMTSKELLREIREKRLDNKITINMIIKEIEAIRKKYGYID